MSDEEAAAYSYLGCPSDSRLDHDDPLYDPYWVPEGDTLDRAWRDYESDEVGDSIAEGGLPF